MRHEAAPSQRSAPRRADFTKPAPAAQTQAPPPEPVAQEPAPAPTNLPTPEEAANDPLVKAVVKVFDGTVKHVYPRK